MRTAEERHADHARKVAALHAKRDERLAAIAAGQERRTAERHATRDERLTASVARDEQRDADRDARRGEQAAAAAARQEQASAARADRKTLAAEIKAAQSRPADRFTALGVQIMSDGMLHTFNGFGGRGSPLGPAAGAVAEVGDERRRHRVSGAVTATILTGAPFAMAGALGKKAKASVFVTLADGTFREHKLEGNAEVSHAHRQAAAFAAAILRLEHEQ